jgi:GNAT superfamily N-acetyltransferase
MLTLKEVPATEIQGHMQDVINSYSHPFDGWYEELLLTADSIGLFHDKRRIVGHICVNDSRIISQFSVRRRFSSEARKMFERFLHDLVIEKAYIPSYDSYFLSIALDNAKKVAIHHKLFIDAKPTEKPGLTIQGSVFGHAVASDHDEIMKLSAHFFDRLEEHLQDDEVFLLKKSGEILGIGVIEESLLQLGVSNMLIFTNPKFRGQGVGSLLAYKLKEQLLELGSIPVAPAESAAGYSTMEKAGFALVGSIIEVEF